MPTIVGIDPGREGGIAVLSWCSGESPVPADMIGYELPANGRLVDHKALLDIIRTSPSLIILEEQQAMPGDGLGGLNYLLPQFGQMMGLFQAWGMPVEVVKPQAWKKVILAGTARDKQAAIDRVMTRWTLVDLRPGKRRKPHDGIADAVCLCEYGMRQFLFGARMDAGVSTDRAALPVEPPDAPTGTVGGRDRRMSAGLDRTDPPPAHGPLHGKPRTAP